MPAMRRVAAVVAAGGGCGLVAWRFLSQDRTPPVSSALQPNKSLTCKLRSVEKLNHNTSRFRFDLPSDEHVLGLSVASHIVAHDGAMVSRAYTPVTLDKFERGYFDLVIKRYPGGEFSEAFHRMRPGETMQFRGPVTTLHYEPNVVSCLGMVAGGTGITPMYQIIRSVLTDPADGTSLRLLYANRTENDILLRDELDALAAQHPVRFQIHYLVGDASAAVGHATRAPNVTTGRVDAAAIDRFLPPPTEPRTAILVCGPEGMMRFLCGDASKPQGASTPPLGGLLRQLGYGRQVVPFLDRN